MSFWCYWCQEDVPEDGLGMFGDDPQVLRNAVRYLTGDAA